MLTARIPRLTASRNGFLARSTALSWPWNKDRILAAPGTLPPSFADLALGVVDRSKPVIRMWCKDPLQREDATEERGTGRLPVALAQARAQGATTQSTAEQQPVDPRVREDDGEDPVSAQHPMQRERPPQLPLRPVGGGEGRGEVGKLQPAEPHLSAATTPAQNPIHRERTGPLRNGNPCGNPNLAPRCGARTRRTGCPCRAPAMRNGRCRLHGGKSTGPRTEEGRARIRAARTRHGLYSAEGRAFTRNITGLLRRNRELLALARQPGPVDHEALRHLLPPEWGKNPLQREASSLPRSVSRAPTGIHPVHPENGTAAPGGGTISAHPRSSMAGPPPAAPPARAGQQNPMQPENGAVSLPHSPPAAVPAALARRPILLARPKAHAP